MMSVHQCDYQLLPPSADSYPSAPTHPDPVIAAQLATVAATARGRRFAFCQVIPARPDATDVVVRPMYQGIQNPDGTCVLLMAGQPYGYYRSIDAAHAHTGRDDLYLTWAEPDGELPDSARSVAAVESRENEVSLWLVALPFLAHGPTDARTRAIDTAAFLEPVTPGLTRQSAMLLSGDNPTSPITLYCPIEPCLREPFHHGDHEPSPDTRLTKTAPEVEALAPTGEPDTVETEAPQ